MIRSGSVLKVAAGENIVAVDVYSISGVNVISVAPQSTDAEISIDALVGGVYVAKIATGNAVKTVKFVK